MTTAKSALLLFAATLPASLLAQQSASVETEGDAKYDATWESIDSRPTPQWWLDAKFGIFIHWGVYSVPAFSEVGRYSEWYWMDLMNPKRGSHKFVKPFHDRVYGKDFTYPEFVPQFTCELFAPDQWAEVFQDSGAKYVVLTSKHHDGYCLWPSKEADKSWGRPWCSTNSGPKRDLVGELTAAVRKTDVRMGLYYSIYEWFNPLYKKDKPAPYVDQVLVPQFKDVVNRYAPSVVFVDGEWDHPAATWKSPALLSWLFSESPCKGEVVINDRWGKGDRHKHGGYYTTEYGAGLPNADNPWEENRGMAHSFGYSRTERFKDYNSSESLIYMLIDIVSRGGNFLLDIGPTADGRIPPLMEERLAEIGDWLEVNGEAIYGTTTHQSSCQWSDGKVQELKHGNYRVKYDVNKLLKNPDEGMARKEVIFTRKGKALYAICPVFPDATLTLEGIEARPGAAVSFLGTQSDALQWKQVGDDLRITIPRVNPSRLPCQHAWTFKVSEVAN
jgi:alpha-L-fucosidase